ncbi:MAG: glycosyltransferase [Sneathiella sp.]
MSFEKNQTAIVVFGEDWGSHPSSTQHLMSYVMGRYPVIWVNSIGLRRPRVSLKDFRRALSKLRGMFQKAPNVKPKLKQEGGRPIEIISPMAFPFFGNSFARRLNEILLSNQVRKALRKNDKRGCILWLSLPTCADLIGRCQDIATIYYAGDDFSALAGVDHKPIIKMEDKLAEKADAIVVPGRVLANKFNPEKTFIVQHGCDFDLFATLVEPARDVDWSRPTAGFYGSLDRWLDQKLVCDLADRNPGWQFLLIGPVKTDIHQLTRRQNIHCLGSRDHHELPSYSQNWDLSLLPFKDDAQIRACNPLKLKEYLAAGRPIATTRFDAAEDYRDVIHICDDPEDFMEAMNTALKSGNNRKKTLQKRVKSEDWRCRAEEVMVLIEALQNEALRQNDENFSLVKPKYA